MKAFKCPPPPTPLIKGHLAYLAFFVDSGGTRGGLILIRWVQVYVEMQVEWTHGEKKKKKMMNPEWSSVNGIQWLLLRKIYKSANKATEKKNKKQNMII